MRPAATNPPYTLLARYYDGLFSFAPSWARDARARILGKVLPRVTSACDLACGTGTTAVDFARGGLRVFAVDLSPAMCRMAREKARREGVPVRVINADMRSFRLPEPVDLVTCEFDAVNHVPRKSDLRLVAQSVARALRPGGWFYFDVNNRLSLEKVWPLTWWLEKPGLIMVMHGEYDAASAKASSTVELLVREGRRWKRSQERVEEVCWMPAEIRSALRAAGFDRITGRDAKPFFKDDPLLRPGYRTFYLARKRPE